MSSFKLRPFLKFTVLGGLTTGTFFSLKSNDYQLNSIGVVRLCRAALTVFDVGATYRRKLYRPGLDKNSPEYEDLKSRCHQHAAEKLLALCCINKGVYIKVGQHIAGLDYLLPKEYVQTMKILHSHAPTNKIEDVYKVLREDLKKDPNEIFSSIDPEPLGAASLAQVHRAISMDGTVLAVKVQHPYVRGNAMVDLKTMETLVKIVGWVFPEFQFQWLVDETKKNIPQELDFIQEGHNAQKVAKAFQYLKWLKVPRIRWDLTSSRVLTMEFVEGGQVNDVQYIRDNDINPYEVTDKLGRLYSEMIFINGFVHSDPHPGNILVKKSDKGDCHIVLLDHGLYARLSNKFRVEYAQLWLSILNRDRKAMRLHSDNLGIQGDLYGLFACMVAGRTWDNIVQGIDKRKQTVKEKEVLQQVLPNVLPQISGILEKVNRQMILIFKTNDLIRGIEHSLGTHSRRGAFRVMTKCCIRSIYDDKFHSANSSIDRFKIALIQYWLLFKLNFYYLFINLQQQCNSIVKFSKLPFEVVR